MRAKNELSRDLCAQRDSRLLQSVKPFYLSGMSLKKSTVRILSNLFNREQITNVLFPRQIGRQECSHHKTKMLKATCVSLFMALLLSALSIFISDFYASYYKINQSHNGEQFVIFGVNE